MSCKKTLNDLAWEKIFIKYKILQEINASNFYTIAAKEIKEYREPRLMTKFDHHSNLPSIFKDNNLSILPITRGDYIIAPMQVYKELDECKNVNIEYFNLPEHLHSLNYDDINSEAAAINCAYASGILEHFFNEEVIPTVNGRMSSGVFNFKIQNEITNSMMAIEVVNSQIEIDGGYEGLNYLYLIEAKNALSSDYLVRQLYYPYRLWIRKIEKPVILVFMVYSNGLFYLYEFAFTITEEINSVVLKKKGLYSLEPREISIDDIINVLNESSIKREPKIPFPQADSFERVINLCELLLINDLSKDEITTTYDFDKRQTDYYINAGRYLRLIDYSEKNGPGCKLSDFGKSIFNLNFRDRQLKFVEVIIEHDVFASALSLYFKKVEEPSRSEIVEIMKQSEVFAISSMSTYRRRAATILSWIRWIMNLINI